MRPSPARRAASSRVLSEGLGDRVDDAVVRAAAAEVAAHPLAQLVAAERDVLGGEVVGDVARHAARQLRRHGDRRADLPRRAVAALEAVMLDERLLQRVQAVAVRQALDRGDLAALVLHRQRQAGVDALAVDQHRAGAAGALVAALLGAGEAEVVAQQVEERGAQVDVDATARPLIQKSIATLLSEANGLPTGTFPGGERGPPGPRSERARGPRGSHHTAAVTKSDSRHCSDGDGSPCHTI